MGRGLGGPSLGKEFLAQNSIIPGRLQINIFIKGT
jgi:hypothetical protein